MIARNILSTSTRLANVSHSGFANQSQCFDKLNCPSVDANTPLPETLHLLLDSPSMMLSVVEHGNIIGYIDCESMLKGLGAMLAGHDECSTIVVECNPKDYSASVVARAVEDADAHLLGLITSPSDNDRLRITLRVSHTDPSAVAKSLLRYGFEVVESYSKHSVDAEVASERLAQLALFLNV